MKRSSKRSALTLIAATWLAVIGTGVCSQGQTQSQAVRAASSRADETLEMWNLIGNKLIAFPEDKYDFKLQKDECSFAENILHVAAGDYDLIRSAGGSSLGPDFGKNKHNPSRDLYKTKTDVVKLIQQAVADGANLIQQQGDAGLDEIAKHAWGKQDVPQILHLDVRHRAQR